MGICLPAHALRRLEHQDEISSWMRSSMPSLASPVMSLLKLGDWDLTYITPG